MQPTDHPLTPGTVLALLLREACADHTSPETLRLSLHARTGREINTTEACRAARTLARYGYLDRPGYGQYALTPAGEAELDRLFTLQATLTPAPAPADARRTA